MQLEVEVQELVQVTAVAGKVLVSTTKLRALAGIALAPPSPGTVMLTFSVLPASKYPKVY